MENLDPLSNIKDVPDGIKWKTMYMMLLRASTISIQNGFHVMALLDELGKKGLIDKEAIEKKATELGEEVTKQVMAMADEMELDIFRESRNIYMKEKLDNQASNEEKPDGEN